MCHVNEPAFDVARYPFDDEDENVRGREEKAIVFSS